MDVLISVLVALGLFYLSGFLIAVLIRNNGIADVMWGLGFVLIAFCMFYFGGELGARQWVVNILVFLWGTRLALYIFIRGLGKDEDYRYKEMRMNWGKDWLWKSFVFVFCLQMMLMLIISLPVIYVNLFDDLSFGWLEILGVVLWGIGYMFEVVGDGQMYLWKRNKKNKGKVMKYGLWKFTRHPNYFGESLMWWSIYLIVVSISGAWWTFVGPLLITFMLLKVSGVSLLEKKYKGNREYREYQRNTSAFIPWVPLR